jgi:hypothetical protein
MGWNPLLWHVRIYLQLYLQQQSQVRLGELSMNWFKFVCFLSSAVSQNLILLN